MGSIWALSSACKIDLVDFLKWIHVTSWTKSAVAKKPSVQVSKGSNHRGDAEKAMS